MKKWKVIVSIVGMSLLFTGTKNVNADPIDRSENFVQISDVGLRSHMIGTSKEYFNEKYQKLSEERREKLDTDLEALEEKFDEIDAVYMEKRTEFEEKYNKKEEEFEQLYEKLQHQLDNKEITKEIYETELRAIDQAYEKMWAEHEIEQEELENKYSYYTKRDILHEQCEEDIENYEKQRLKELEPMKVYGLLSKEVVENVSYFDTEVDSLNYSLAGLEYAVNLKEILGEPSSPVIDARPLLSTKKLETIMYLHLDNQINLNSLKNLHELKILRMYSIGYANYEEEEEARNSEEEVLYTQALLTDISILSDLTQLEDILIGVKGVMQTVTLEKGTTSYQIYDPIVPSQQFEGAQMSYVSYINNRKYSDYEYSSNDEVRWENLTGDEEFLSFEFSITKGKFEYWGEGQIPLRWK